jgi:hypothetical protein
MSKEKKTNWRKRFFNWHLWSGLIFTIPILLVSLTAILIAHEKGLGTKEIAVNAGWLPGYGSEENIKHYLDDVKDVQIVGNKTYYASKLGVVIEENQTISILKNTEGNEVRDLQLVGDSLWIASKNGLFVFTKNTALLLKKGDFHGINTNGNKLYASEGKHGFHISSDNGKTWVNSTISKTVGKEILNSFSKSIEKETFIEKLTLEKLALDIHTGKAFFGNGSMWIWIDLIALSLLFMTFTGIWMWYKRKYGKKKSNNSYSK